jgi:PRC-barrel domain
MFTEPADLNLRHLDGGQRRRGLQSLSRPDSHAVGAMCRPGSAIGLNPSIHPIVTLIPWTDRAAAQEVALTPLEATEVARGYRVETIKLKPVVNYKNETIGRIIDFIFGKDGNTYAILAVGDFTGLGGHLIAVPFRNLKLDDPSGYVVLPGASRSALEKLPVFVSNNR